MRTRALLLLLLAALAVPSSSDFVWPSFSTSSGAPASLLLVGTANVTGDRLRLTPPVEGASGAAWCVSAPLPSSHSSLNAALAGTCFRKT